MAKQSKQWKEAERRLARLFNTERRALSGGNSKTGRDDAMHPTLFLENKYSQRHSVWSLYRKTKELASKEGRIPVIGLQEKNKQGILIVVHSSDLKKVAAFAVAESPPKKTGVPRPLRRAK